MLPAAHATHLRVVTCAGENLLQNPVEELRFHPRRQRQQDQEPGLVVARKLADETAEWAVIGQQGHVHAVLGHARLGTRTEVRTQPPFQNAFELPEGSNEISHVGRGVGFRYRPVSKRRFKWQVHGLAVLSFHCSCESFSSSFGSLAKHRPLQGRGVSRRALHRRPEKVRAKF